MAVATETRPSGVPVARSDATARSAMAMSLVFLVVSAGSGLLAAAKLAFPALLEDYGFFSYGRLAPMALASLVFGWLTFANLAAVYYLLPRLTGVAIRHERLASAAIVPTAVVTLVGILAVGIGFGEGRLLSEFPWWIDLPLVLLYLVPLGTAATTILQRAEEGIYISLWYVLGGLIWLVGAMVVGNVPGLGGTGSALQNGFFVAGIVGMWATGVGIGAVYYILPKVTGNPLFSRPLAVAGFWSLAFASLWTGPTRSIFGPAPDWIETTGVVFTLGLVVPALAVLTNFVGTVRGRWDLVRERSELKFGIVAAVASLFLALVTGVAGFRSVAAIVGLTQFDSGTRYGLLYGAASLYAASLLYHAFPNAFGRRLFSESMGRLHLRLTLWGVGAFALFMWSAGVLSGYTWLAGAYTGAFANFGDGFLQTVDSVGFLYTLASIAALVVAAGQLVLVANLYRTYTSGEAIATDTLVEVPAEAAS